MNGGLRDRRFRIRFSRRLGGMALDTSGLTRPVSKDDLKTFGESFGTRFPDAHVRRGVMGAVAVIAVSAVFVFVGTLQLRTPGPGLVFLFVGATALVFAIVQMFRRPGRRAQAKLDRFARDNGMSFHPGVLAPQLPGMLFGIGRERGSSDLVRAWDPRFIEYGNYGYTTGSGKNRTRHSWGYIAMQLDTPLPNIVLDARANNGLFGSNLPVSLARGQRLSLEGDFDEHFSLYCPEGYEADALYLFTPDVMARFVDVSGSLDVEIVDDWIFFYSTRDIVTLQPDQWERLIALTDAMSDKIDRWGRWRDERLGVAHPAVRIPSDPLASLATDPVSAASPGRAPRGVAHAGRRLRRGPAWGAIVFIAVAIVIQIFIQTR